MAKTTATYILARLNVLDNVMAQLIALTVVTNFREPKDQATVLNNFRHNVREVCRREIALPSHHASEAIDVQAAMLDQVDAFFGLVEKVRAVST